MREAVSLAGHYPDGAEASRYYRRVADEINAACDAKKLACLPGRNTLTPPWNPAYWTPLWQRVATSSRFLLSLDGATVYAVPSVGDQGQLEAAAQFTGERVFTAQYDIDGWAWKPGAALAFDVVDHSGRSWVSAAKTGLPSEDVDKYFRDKGVVASEAKQARFKIETWCVLDCNLRILAGNTQIAQIPLTGEPTTINRNDFNMSIGSFQTEHGTFRQAQRNWLKLSALDAVYRGYKLVFPWLGAAALVVFVVAGVLAAVRREVHQTLARGGRAACTDRGPGAAALLYLGKFLPRHQRAIPVPAIRPGHTVHYSGRDAVYRRRAAVLAEKMSC
ncbi:MAG: hypothetical protein WDN04_21395 [Rhodospirillales bacterium]